MTVPTPHDNIIVWYNLVDANGDPYQNLETFGVRIAPTSTVCQLRDTVHKANEAILADVHRLDVFASREDIYRNHPLSNLPKTTLDTPVYIAVLTTD
jgi:hypothetical protein